MQSLPLFPGYRFGYPGGTAPAYPHPGTARCERCPRSGTGTAQFLEAQTVREGPADRVIVAVQSVPLAFDYKQGGYRSEYALRLARLLDRVAKDRGVEYRLDVVAALACGDGDDHKAAADRATAACRGHLVRNVRALGAGIAAIVAVGSTPMLSLLGERVEHDTAAPGRAYLGNVPVVFFPEFYDWGNRWRIVPAEESLLEALDAPHGGMSAACFDVRNHAYDVVETIDEAEQALADTEDAVDGVVALDVETSGRKFAGDHRMEAIALAWRDPTFDTVRSVVFGKPLMVGAGRQLLKQWIESTRPRQLGGHFVSSDMASFTKAWGATPRGFAWDTRTLRKLLHPNAGAALDEAAYMVGLGGAKAEADEALEQVRKELTAFGKKKDRKLETERDRELLRAVTGIRAIGHEKEPWRAYAYGLIPEDILYRYVARDTVVSLLLRERLLPAVEREGLRWLWDEVASQFHQVSYHLNLNGMPVDRRPLEAFRIELEATKATARAAAAIHFPDAKTDEEVETAMNSAVQIADVLSRAGVTTGKTTATGRMQTDADSLERLKGSHPLIDAVLTHRSAEKLDGTYVGGLLVRIGDDDCVHPTFLPIVESFRSSARDPNGQNIPSRSAEGRRIRTAFVARPGRVLVEHDFSQFQLRILAVESGDRVMSELFQAGVDIHFGSAKRIAPFWGKTPDQIGKAERSDAKTIIFSLVFDKSDAVLAEELNTTVERAAELHQQILGQFVSVAPYMEGKKAEARKTGRVWVRVNGRNVFRRPMPEIGSSIPAIRANAERAASNTAIQGPEAVIAMGALVRIIARVERGELPGVRILMCVHDSILAEVPADMVPAYDQAVRECMAWLPIGGGVPVVVDAKFGPNWADMKDLKAA